MGNPVAARRHRAVRTVTMRPGADQATLDSLVDPMSLPSNLESDSVAEIVPGDRSGGPNTSHTIVFPALRELLETVPWDAGESDYERAVVDENLLGKAAEGARRRTYRYLRELYLLRPESVLFRALRDLWPDEAAAQPLLAGLCAVARDPVFRASAPAILDSSPGDEVSSRELSAAVAEQFPDSYRQSTLDKIGRNTASSWEQAGHLTAESRYVKRRVRAASRPANAALALLLGHLEGVRGEPLFSTLWTRLLDTPKGHLVDLAFAASQRGFIEFRNAGGVIEVGFKELLREFPEVT